MKTAGAVVFCVVLACVIAMVGASKGYDDAMGDPPRHIQMGTLHIVTASNPSGVNACEPEMLRICPGGYRVLHHRAHWECVFRCEEVNP